MKKNGTKSESDVVTLPNYGKKNGYSIYILRWRAKQCAGKTRVTTPVEMQATTAVEIQAARKQTILRSKVPLKGRKRPRREG
jgi:hypothetical protein